MPKYVISGEIENLSWEEFFAKGPEWLSGFNQGYKKCAQDNAVYKIGRQHDRAKGLEPDLKEFFANIGLSTKEADTMAFMVCCVIGKDMKVR